MKQLGLTIVLFLLGVKYALADQYETYAFGDSEAEACEQVKSDLKDQAILTCRMNGGLFEKADYGKCRITESSGSRYKAVRSVQFSCKPKLN
jgi:hypothetical protein